MMSRRKMLGATVAATAAGALAEKVPAAAQPADGVPTYKFRL